MLTLPHEVSHLPEPLYVILFLCLTAWLRLPHSMAAKFQEELVTSTYITLANVPLAKGSHMATPRVGGATQSLEPWEQCFVGVTNEFTIGGFY